jgi:hypothetical protein
MPGEFFFRARSPNGVENRVQSIEKLPRYDVRALVSVVAR